MASNGTNEQGPSPDQLPLIESADLPQPQPTTRATRRPHAEARTVYVAHVAGVGWRVCLSEGAFDRLLREVNRRGLDVSFESAVVLPARGGRVAW